MPPTTPTAFDVAQDVQLVRENGDQEAAHGNADAIRQRILEAIAEHSSDEWARSVAAAAVQLDAIEKEQGWWYA